jgi:hypothetical protein
MRKIIIVLLLLSNYCLAQSNVEYISEKCDSMALIDKHDIDVINNVFSQRNQLRRLNHINTEIITKLEVKTVVLDSIISKQKLIIQNNQLMQAELKNNYDKLYKKYNSDLKKERNKTISFQALTGIGIVVIIILLL